MSVAILGYIIMGTAIWFGKTNLAYWSGGTASIALVVAYIYNKISL